MTTEKIGQIPQGEGKLFGDTHATVVRKVFGPQRPMQRHNHPGFEIILTVIQGQGSITLEDREIHALKSGDILIFNGNHHISGEFPQETVLGITLVRLHS